MSIFITTIANILDKAFLHTAIKGNIGSSSMYNLTTINEHVFVKFLEFKIVEEKIQIRLVYVFAYHQKI